MKHDTNKFIAFLAIVATPFALGAFFLTWAPSAQFASEDPAGPVLRSIELLDVSATRFSFHIKPINDLLALESLT